MPRLSLIVPAYNDHLFLMRTLPASAAALSRHGDAELIVVDNGSDESVNLHGLIPSTFNARVLRLSRSTIAAARNAGAAEAGGDVLVFLDADCVIGAEHLVEVERTLQMEDVDAVGGGFLASNEGNWIEDSWDTLHPSQDAEGSDVKYLPSGNFSVTKQAFQSVGGFDEILITGEDAEICQRLIRSGYVLRTDPTIAAIHLGNPKTIKGFWKRNVWHGLGMFGTARRNWMDKPTLMLGLHLLLTGCALLATAFLPLLGSILLLLGSQLIVPSFTVVYRSITARSADPVAALRGILLYWLYFWARAYALILITGQRATEYSGWTDRRLRESASDKMRS